MYLGHHFPPVIRLFQVLFLLLFACAQLPFVGERLSKSQSAREWPCLSVTPKKTMSKMMNTGGNPPAENERFPASSYMNRCLAPLFGKQQRHEYLNPAFERLEICQFGQRIAKKKLNSDPIFQMNHGLYRFFYEDPCNKHFHFMSQPQHRGYVDWGNMICTS